MEKGRYFGIQVAPAVLNQVAKGVWEFDEQLLQLKLECLNFGPIWDSAIYTTYLPTYLG